MLLAAPARGTATLLAQSGEGIDVRTFPRWSVYLVWALLIIALAVWFIRRRRG